MICSNCGAENNDNARFCASCGANLSAQGTPNVSDTEENLDATIGEAPNTPATPVPPDAAIPPEAANGDSNPPKRRRGLRWPLIALLAIALIALAFVGINAYRYWDQSQVIINKDAVIYDESTSPYRIISSDIESVTVSSTDGLEQGKILASGVVDGAPDGLLRRIDSIEPTSEGYKLNTTPAALTEAIDKCHVSYTIYLDSEGQAEVKSNNTFKVWPFQDQAFADEMLKNICDYEDDYAKVYAGDELNVDLEINFGYIHFKLTERINAGAEFGFDDELEYSYADLLTPKFERPVAFMIGPMPVVLCCEIGPEASLDFNAVLEHFEVGGSLDISFGFEYTSGKGLEPVLEDRSQAPYVEYTPKNGRIQADISAETDIVGSCMIYGLAGGELTVGLRDEAAISLVAIGQDEAAENPLVLGEERFKGRVDYKCSIPVNVTFKSIDLLNPFEVIGAIDSIATGKATKASAAKKAKSSSSASASKEEKEEEEDDPVSVEVNTDDEENLAWEFDVLDTEIVLLEEGGWYGAGGQGNSDGKARDIALVLDTSGSMKGEALEQLKVAVELFDSSSIGANANVGMVTFASSGNVIRDINDASSKTISRSADELSASGGTNMGEGLTTAKEMLDKGTSSTKAMVIMSDGMPSAGMDEDELIEYADQLKDDGYTIYTLGFLSELNDSERARAQRLLNELASTGSHYEAENASDLRFFFGDIADQIEGMRYIYIRIACPVDVEVSYDGETLSSADPEDHTRTSFGSLTFEEPENDEDGNGNNGNRKNSGSSSSSDSEDANEEDSVKILRLKEGPSYDVQIRGTGNGTMDYTIGFVDDAGSYSDMRSFNSIPITPRTRINTMAEVADTTVLKVDEDGDGKYDLTYKAEQNGLATLTNNITIVYLVVAAFAAVGVLSVLLLILLSVKRHKRHNRQKA